MRFRLLQTMALAAIGSWVSVCPAADIVDTAVGAGQFKTLAAALDAAQLIDTLKGEGPFTVLAPTDEAFAKLPEAAVADLLKPENRAKLTAILTYHVVPGKVEWEQVTSLKSAATVNGQQLKIKVNVDGVTVDQAKIVKTDIRCDNGVIHVIDSVLMPSTTNIPETAKAAGKFSTLLAAVEAAGLAEVLSGDGPFTVFAPTDEAFAQLPAGTVESLLKPENKDKLVEVLKYHVVSGRVYADKVLQSGSVTTLQGSPAAVTVQDGAAKIQGATIISTDINATNGVIHVIDNVLLPPPSTAQAQQKLQDAVAHGAKLYNAGHHSQCAAIYHSTMQDLMSSALPESIKSQMASVMEEASHTQCPTQRAWVLRRGIDSMHAQLSKSH